MPGNVRALAAACLAAAGLVAVPSGGADATGGPALLESAQRMADALHCATPPSPTRQEPVLLVHGIAATGADELGPWVPAMLARGRPACTVDLPDRALGDNQRAAEYVVAAVRSLAKRFGSKVDIVAASQGPMTARWALKWWPDVRARVDDFVSVAGIAHGTALGRALCASGHCVPAVWQWRPGSAYLTALNSGDETPGDVDYTSLSTKGDVVVFPQVPSSVSDIAGAVNVPLDELCPGRVPDHVQIIYDAVAFAAAVDALDHDGPFDPERFDPSDCTRLFMPGVNPADAAARIFLVYEAGGPQGLGITWPTVSSEPRLRAYATPGTTRSRRTPVGRCAAASTCGS